MRLSVKGGFKFRRTPYTLGRTQRYTYDRAGRLSALTKTSPSGHAQDSTTYQYDPNGNLTSSQRERAATTTTRSYRTESGHNKLLGFEQTTRSASASASTSVTHQYDAAGNLQSDGLHQYHYDSQGRLQSSQTGQGPDAPTTRYAHNALGQRVFKTEPLFAAASSKDSALDDEEEDPSLLQTLVDFFTKLWNPAKSEAEHLGWAYLYDEDGSLLGEYGMGGAQSAGQSQYLYLPTAQGPIPIAAEIDSRLYAIHTDHLGTPRRLTQADGQAAWQWAYTPYGDEAPTLGAKRFTNETTNPTTGSTGIAPVRFNLRYPGQYFDEESGLHYNYFRSYDPRTGRYTQTDPIGLEGGWNRFAYVGGNPLNNTDSLGLSDDALPAILGGGAAIPSLTNACLANPWACGPVLAGAGGYTLGTLLYPVIEGPVSGLVDWCMESRGRGERGATGGTSGQGTKNPYKHCKLDPKDPRFIICTNHQTGKKTRKPTPPDFPQ